MNITISDSQVTITNNSPSSEKSLLGEPIYLDEDNFMEDRENAAEELFTREDEIFEHLKSFEGGLSFERPTEVGAWSCQGEIDSEDPSTRDTAVSLFFQGVTLSNADTLYDVSLCLTLEQTDELIVAIHDAAERYRAAKELYEKSTVRA